MVSRALVLLIALLLAGCGSDDDSAADTGTATTGEAVEIVETDFALDPASVTVEAAGETTFRVVNDGATTHALEIEGGGIEEETEEIAPGESAELTVELDDGEYELYCPIGNHREQGMEGTLVVGAGAGAADTGETDTDEDNGYGG
jgi:uncharacterized cupredoxin-like copper-binding protein